MNARYITAAEAAAMLDVSVATLYAYVSRGMIRSEGTGAGRRSRLYSREDVERLIERKTLRKQPAKAVAEALHWGTPVLDSAITAIAGGRLHYRGHDVTRLARERTFEEVAELLWRGELPSGPSALPPVWKAPASAEAPEIELLIRERPAVERFQILLPVVAGNDPRAFDLRPAAMPGTGARIVRTLAAIAAGGGAIETGIAEALRKGWSPKAPRSRDLYGAALIVSADHELNVSTFTARCIASAGSSLHAAVAGGIGAMLGHKHGGHTRRVEALAREIVDVGSAREVVTARLGRGETIPGFGHPLYPDGDPRAALLLEMIGQSKLGGATYRFMRDVAATIGELIEEHPTIDFALVTLTRALGIPAEHALTLFTLGRSVGWIGHAMEEYAANRIIRPRARYTGVDPIEE